VTGLSLGSGTSYDVVTVKYQASSTSNVAAGEEQIPRNYELRQNYPNPFNSSTVIGYALPRSGYVRLDVFTTLGEKIKTLADGVQNAGSHRIVFDTRGLASGLYFYQLVAGDFVETKKLILLR
jgi:hypothetical protein